MEQESKFCGKSVQRFKCRQFLSVVRFPFLKHYVTRNLCSSELTAPHLRITPHRLYMCTIIRCQGACKILFLSVFYLQHTK